MPEKAAYGIVPQAVMRDKQLSLEAKAIYAYLCTFADTKGECYPSAEIMFAELRITAQRFFKYRKELQESGLVSVQKIRGDTGRYEKTVYTLSQQTDLPRVQNPHMEKPHMEKPHMEKPHVEKPHVEKPHVDYPHVENQHTNNTSINNTSINNTSIINTSTNSTSINNTREEQSPHTPQGGQAGKPKKTRSRSGHILNERGWSIPGPSFRPDDFEQWWEAYPGGENRDGTITEWEEAIKNGRLPALSVLLEALEWQVPTYNWRQRVKGDPNPNYTPYPERYLQKSRWQDKRPAPYVSPTCTQSQKAPVYDPNRTWTGEEMLAYYTNLEREFNEEMAQKKAQKEQAASAAIGE